MRQVLVVAALLSFLLWACGAQAQVLYPLESPNPENNGNFGWSVCEAGDVDGDGWGDLILGACQEYGGAYHAGRAYVFSGGDGSVLHSLLSPQPASSGLFGACVAGAGDVDTDGFADVVVGAPYEYVGAPLAGRAYIFSGQTGSVLHALESPNAEDGGCFGFPVSWAGDVNADGNDDVIVGAHKEDVGYGDVGRAYVFDGYSGSLIRALESPNPEYEGMFGNSVSRVGDVDGDGCDDVIVGALREDAGAPDAGRVYLFSGQTGAVLHTFQSPNPGLEGCFGVCTSGCEDVNGDGMPDLVVGAWHESGGASGAGRAYILSGAGTLLSTLESPNPEVAGDFGYSVSSAGDIDGDSVSDVTVGCPLEDGGASNAGRAYIFSGSTGSLIHTVQSPSPESDGRFGHSVAGVEDLDGDGMPELIMGAYLENGGAANAGKVYVFSGANVPVELASFTAEPRSAFVRLEWTTRTETNNLGFHVWRTSADRAAYQQVTESLVPGAGTTSETHEYDYLDQTVRPGTTYFYKLADVDVQGNQTFHGPVSVTVTPVRLALLGNHPNPFSQTTTISLNLAAPGHVSLKIYNAAGDLVRTLADGETTPGEYDIRWDGRDDAGHAVPPGTYACRLEARGMEQSHKMVLVE